MLSKIGHGILNNFNQSAIEDNLTNLFLAMPINSNSARADGGPCHTAMSTASEFCNEILVLLFCN